MSDPAPQRDLRAPLLTAGVLGGLTLVLAVRDPHVPGSYGVCPVYAVTGLLCAGCGALRATHELATLDVAAAWALNPLWVLVVPVLLGLWVAWLGVRAGWWRLSSPSPALVASAWGALGVLVIGFSVLRNVVGDGSLVA